MRDGSGINEPVSHNRLGGCGTLVANLLAGYLNSELGEQPQVGGTKLSSSLIGCCLPNSRLYKNQIQNLLVWSRQTQNHNHIFSLLVVAAVTQHKQQGEVWN